MLLASALGATASLALLSAVDARFGMCIGAGSVSAERLIRKGVAFCQHRPFATTFAAHTMPKSSRGGIAHALKTRTMPLACRPLPFLEFIASSSSKLLAWMPAIACPSLAFRVDWSAWTGLLGVRPCQRLRMRMGRGDASMLPRPSRMIAILGLLLYSRCASRVASDCVAHAKEFGYCVVLYGCESASREEVC